MADEVARRIKSVTARPGYRLTIGFDRGSARSVDLSDMISKGGVFSPLSDNAAFAAVRIGENSRTVEWPVPADEDGDPLIAIDADALFDKSERQQSDAMASHMRRLSNLFRNVKARPAGSPAKV